MKLHYFIREYSESMEFPEVHIFATEEEARATMIAEAKELLATLGEGWITEELDGDPITFCLSPGQILAQTVTTLNVQRNDWAVDIFRMGSQEVTL